MVVGYKGTLPSNLQQLSAPEVFDLIYGDTYMCGHIQFMIRCLDWLSDTHDYGTLVNECSLRDIFGPGNFEYAMKPLNDLMLNPYFQLVYSGCYEEFRKMNLLYAKYWRAGELELMEGDELLKVASTCTDGDTFVQWLHQSKYNELFLALCRRKCLSDEATILDQTTEVRVKYNPYKLFLVGKVEYWRKFLTSLNDVHIPLEPDRSIADLVWEEYPRLWDAFVNVGDKPSNVQLSWCRANAPESMRDASVEELWEVMKESWRLLS